MATGVMGVTLEPEKPHSRPTSAVRIGRSPPPTGGSLRASVSASKVVHLGDLGVLKTTNWNFSVNPEKPPGLAIELDNSTGSVCDVALAKSIYEAAVRGDATAITEAAASLVPPLPKDDEAAAEPAEGEEPPKPPFPKLMDVYGLEPLALAAGLGHAEVVGALLAAGANPDVQSSSKGESAIHRAARAGHGALVTTLLESGATANIAAIDGATPLHMAAHRGQAEAITALLAAEGIQCDKPDLRGRSALMMAAQAGHTTATTTLLNGGASANIVDEDGWTALLLACQGKHSPCAELLGARGADLTAKTKGARSAVMLAPEIAELLAEQAEERAEAAKAAEAADAETE